MFNFKILKVIFNCNIFNNETVLVEGQDMIREEESFLIFLKVEW